MRKDVMRYMGVFRVYFSVLIGLVMAFGGPISPAFAQSADVPEAVLIPRPSSHEIEQAEMALEAFKASASDETALLLQSYPTLIEVRPPGVNYAIIPRLNRQFFTKHNNNLAVAEAGDIDLLFMGDSITDFWRNETGQFAGRPVQDKYFSQWNVANFGIAGDTTQGVLYRLQNGEAEGYEPKAVMLMIGTNNTRANSAPQIAEGVGAIVLELRESFPDAKILLLGVFPRGAHDDPARETIADINAIIQRLDDGAQVFYRDIGEVFLDENGNIPESVMSDGLHPSTEGYELWAEAVIEPLRALME